MTAGLKLLGGLCYHLLGGPFGNILANLEGACISPSLKRNGFDCNAWRGIDPSEKPATTKPAVQGCLVQRCW